MAYSNPPTFGAGNWTVSDANTYITANMQSLRNYQSAKRTFADSIASIGSTLTTVATHYTLCTVTPGEPSVLQVAVQIQSPITSSAGGPPTLIGVTLLDQTGVQIGQGLIYLFTPTQPVGCVLGGQHFAAGVNPGYAIQLQTNVASTLSGLIVSSIATVAPNA